MRKKTVEERRCARTNEANQADGQFMQVCQCHCFPAKIEISVQSDGL